MVNLKTKSDKHANDDEKRCKSIKNKEKVKFQQSRIIKEALSNSSLSNKLSKRIVFDDENDNNNDAVKNGSKNNTHKKIKPSLFENSDSENENFEIKEKTQFSGKKGFELLNLQSTYGNDERFRIDERFLEDEANEEKAKNIDVGGEEKTQQLKILESVLGTSLINPEKEKKTKKRTYEMIRYDVSNKDHQIYEKSIQSETKTLAPSKKKKENKKILKSEKQELSKPKVSKDKFYEVSSEIRDCFKEKHNEHGQFSLLQTYGLNDCEKNEEVSEKEVRKKKRENIEESDGKQFVSTNCDFEKTLEAKEELASQKPKEEESSVEAKGIWKESFFFNNNDERFEEALKFINKKGSLEADEAAENYGKTRRTLREILRLHLKKQMLKKNPFRNKVGGMNKKQLANSKFQNSKTPYNKRKMNSNRAI